MSEVRFSMAADGAADNVLAALADPAPTAKSATANLVAAGLSWSQIFTLIVTYGPALWSIVSTGGKFLADVIDAIRNGKPLPPLPV